MKFIGTSNVVLRLFNVTAALGTIACTYLLTQELETNKETSILASLLLLSNIEFLFRARQINVEIMLTFFLIFSLMSLLKAVKNKSLLWYLLTFGAWALAFLTKRATPLLIVPTLVAILIHYRRKLNYRYLLIGSGLFLLIVVPWFWLNYMRWHEVFIQEFFIKYTLGKITSINPVTGVSYFYYASSLKHAFKIFSIGIPLAYVWYVWKVKASPAKQFLLIYITTFFLFLSLAAIKASWYLIPTYPAIAIMIAGFLHSLSTFMSKRVFMFVVIMPVFFK